MSNTNKNLNKNAISLKHSNLMLSSTTLSMCTGVVLLLIYTSLKGSMNSFVFARTMCGAVSAVFFAAGIVLAVMTAKKDKCFLEFSIFSFVMSLGFLSMLGVPFFLLGINGIEKLFVTKYVIFTVAVLDVLYLVLSLVYHTIKSNRK